MRGAAFLLAAVLLAAGGPLAAQDAAPVTAEQAIETAKEVYGPPDPKAKATCPRRAPADGGEIVVCAEQQEQSQFRVKSSGDLDPAGAGAHGGVPRAPDVGTHYPGAVVATGCFIPPCPPPMPKIIDLKAIPEAPPGSDADRVAHGLAPRGGSDATLPPPPPVPESATSEEKAPPATPPGSA